MFLDELNNHAPQSKSWAEPKQTNELRLFKGLGNIAEFAAYFSGGLLLALTCRLIPKMLVFYIILKVGAVGYLWLSHSDAEEHVRKSLRLTGLAIALSSIAGYWDGILATMLILNQGQWLGLVVALLVLVGIVFAIFGFLGRAK